MKFPPINEQMDLIRRGASEIISEEELAAKLERAEKTQEPLRVKLGCDPSRPDLHLGHAVVLRKLRQFQDLGHHAILIVGDFTGMIGDPSGRNKARPSLSLEDTRLNGRSYFEQASRILNPDAVTIQFNSDWLSKMNFEDVIKLASKYTVARMLERDEFEKRYKKQEPISIHEFLYPLAQAMDSVAIKSDVELGGTDQKFNLLVGREIQREYGQPPQIILTMPLLVGTDGVEKMSKSMDNYIAFTDSPEDQYGKTLSIPDTLIETYFRLATPVGEEMIAAIKLDIESGSNPRDYKRQLARAIVKEFYGEEKAFAAEEHFDRVIKDKLPPENIETIEIPAGQATLLLDILVQSGLVPSKGEGRRLIQQSAISIDGEKISDPLAELPGVPECIIKVGKRRFVKLIQK